MPSFRRQAPVLPFTLLLALGCLLASQPGRAGGAPARAPGPRGTTLPYDQGQPEFVDLYIDPAKGNDQNPGIYPDTALRTLAQAWINVLKYAHNSGVRINILPGILSFDRENLNRYILRRQALERPIVIRAANGPGTVTISGGLEFESVSYLYLQDLTVSILSPGASIGRNVLRFWGSDHILLRNLQLNWSLLPAPGSPAGGLLEMTRCEYVFVEDSDFGAAPTAGADMLSVQHGHFFRNRFRNIPGWAVQLRAGSAYWRLERNRIAECGAGILAGGTSNLAEMRFPWINYEAYDVKAVNNLLHDLPGPGFAAAGAYCAQFAHNTLFRVGTYRDQTTRGEPLFLFTQGGRTCGPSSLPGLPEDLCAGRRAEGGWGPTVQGVTEPIPNFHVYASNNIALNPAPYQTRNAHFGFAPEVVPGPDTGIPSPCRADVDVRLRSNVVWNGPPDHPLGAGGPGQGCTGVGTICDPSQLLAENFINRLLPQLIAPSQGDFRPRAGTPLFFVPLLPMPPFSWTELPPLPPVPEGDLDTRVDVDFAGAPRDQKFLPGAYSGVQPPPYTVSGTVTDQYFVPLSGVQIAFQLVKGAEPAPAPVITGKDGAWTRPGVPGEGTYRAIPSRAGYNFNPPLVDFSTPREDLNFTGLVDGYAVFGFVVDQHDHAISGATLTFVGLNARGRPTPGAAVTDITGFFTQVGFKKRARYRVTVGKQNYRFTPRNITFGRPGKALVFRGKRFR